MSSRFRVFHRAGCLRGSDLGDLRAPLVRIEFEIGDLLFRVMWSCSDSKHGGAWQTISMWLPGAHQPGAAPKDAGAGGGGGRR